MDGGGGPVTMQLAPWHWRDKFDARNPEEANRQQLLKIEKQISFAKWLKAKRKEERKRNAAVSAALAAKREEEAKERVAKEKERKDNKRRQREDAKQRKEELNARERAEALQKLAANEKAKRLRAKNDKVKNAYTSVMRCASKPESERPSFKEWMARKKREDREKLRPTLESAKDPADASITLSDSEKLELAQRAYTEWMECKHMEDRVKHKRAKEEQLQQALDQKVLHAQTWQKKAIVCAYSQNRGEKDKWRATTASLLS